jgi:3-phenylpropionate/trans-cinnamate dioxygenase ferredoxin component
VEPAARAAQRHPVERESPPVAGSTSIATRASSDYWVRHPCLGVGGPIGVWLQSPLRLVARPSSRLTVILCWSLTPGVLRPQRSTMRDRKRDVGKEPVGQGSAAGAGVEKNGGRMGELATVTALDELGSRELAAFGVRGNRIAIARVGDAFYAFGDTCTHQGCSLADGELAGTTVTCPCHGSQFDATTGDVLRGPAGEPVRSYPVRLEDNALQVEV